MKKRFLRTLFLVGAFILCGTTDVDAQNEVKEIREGDTVAVTVKLEEEFEEGVLSYLEGEIVYNQEVFEAISFENVELSSNITNLKFVDDEFVVKHISRKDGDYITLNFQVKDAVKVGSEEIRLENLEYYNEDSHHSLDEISYGFNIIENQSNLELEEATTEVSKELHLESETEEKSNLMLYVGLGITLIGLGWFVFSIKKKHKIMMAISIAIVVAGILWMYLNSRTEDLDVNEDGVVDEEDVETLQNHLISMEETIVISKEEGEASSEEEQREATSSKPYDRNLDVNKDGEVDLKDLGLLETEVEKDVLESFHTEFILSDYYFEQGETISFELALRNHAGYGLEKLVINGEEIEFANHDFSQLYSIVMPGYEKPGIYEMTLDEVVLSNGRRFTNLGKLQVEVLKKDVAIEGFDVTMESEKRAKIAFDVENPDDITFSTASVNIVAGDESVASEKVTSGQNSLEMDVRYNTEYTVNIDLEYDLATGELGKGEDYQRRVTYTYLFRVLEDGTVEVSTPEIGFDEIYKMNVIQSVVMDQEFQETAIVAKNEAFYLTLDFEIVGSDRPTKILLNDSYVELVEKEDGELVKPENNSIIKTYYAQIPGQSVAGPLELRVDKVETMLGISTDVSNTAQVEIVKEKPSLEMESAVVDEATGLAEITWLLQDTDRTLQSMSYAVYNEGNVIIGEADLAIDTTELTLDTNGLVEGEYTIRIFATYSINEGHLMENEELGHTSYTVPVRVAVTDFSLEQSHIEKEDTLGVTLTVESNREEIISGVIVNDTVISVEQSGSGAYIGQLNVAFLEAGKKKIDLSKVIFEDEVEVEVESEAEIEILKSPLTMSEVIIEEDFSGEEITLVFTINDPDAGFKKGQLIVRNNLKEQLMSHNLTVGENTVTIPVKIGERYSVTIDAQRTKDIAETMLEDVNLYTHEIGLVSDYNFAFENLQSKDLENQPTVYFEKGESFKLYFTSSNDSVYIPKKLKINGTEYTVTKEAEANTYSVVIVAEDTSGVYDYSVTEAVLENNYVEDIGEMLQVEVLKSMPTPATFVYEKLEDGKIRIYLDIVDNSAVTGYTVRVHDGTSVIYSNDSVDKMAQYIDFTPTISEEYSVQISAMYDLDSNTLTADENASQVLLFDEIVELTQEFIEIKDVSDIILYKATGDTSEQLTEVKIEDLNTTDYFVEVKDGYGNQRYADVMDYSVKDQNLYLTLDIKNSVTHTDKKSEGTIVKFGGVVDGVSSKINFEEFIRQLTQNPSATVSLTNDLDASELSISEATYLETFKGVIQGNGYSIKNTSKPLFQLLDGATIENLVIENANVTQQSILSILSANQVSIQNVHIKNSSIKSGDSTGGFVGHAQNGSDLSIENSSITHTTIEGGRWIGGMVGKQYGQLTIKNSYVQGKIKSSWNAAGGILGESYYNITFENLYADVILDTPGTTSRGGFVGYGGGHTDKIINSISLATGVDGEDGYRLTGQGGYIFENNYTLIDSSLKDQAGAQITNIKREDITSDFLEDTVKFDPTVWNLEDMTEGGVMPTLLGLDSTSSVKEGPTNDVSIANYGYVSKLATYEEAREMTYHNMNVIMPHLDAETLIRYGNTIPADHALNQVKVEKIYPIDAQGNLVVGLNTDTKASIAKIRMVFEDEVVEEYDVTFEKMLDSVSVYEVATLGIKYNYPKLVFHNQHPMFQEVLTTVSGLQYYDDISVVTTEVEDRLYNDYYRDYYATKIEEEVLDIFETMPSYTLTNDSENISNRIKSELMNQQRLESILYTANYFDRYYNFEVGIAKDLSDVIFFESDLYSDSKVSAENLVSETLNTSQANRGKDKSITFYNEILKPKYGGLDIKTFLESQVLELARNQNPDQWFAEQFSGILVERQLEAPELAAVRFTAWDQINMRNHLLLPILSMPGDTQDDLYIMSGPTQITIGSLNRYQPHLDGDTEVMRQHIERYADMALSFYETSATYQPNPVHWFNERTNIQYDTRFDFPAGAPTPGTQEFGTSEDSVFKWINETIGVQSAANGSGAYANGTDVYWVVYSALWTDFSFSVWTHETAHNQDGRYFYNGNWRRSGTGAEDHADYNIAQNMHEGHYTPNQRYDLDTNSDLSVNLKLDRIIGEENIHSFYEYMFDAYYLLDYLTAQAFLQLTPSQQAKLVTQVSYIDASGVAQPVASAATGKTAYTALSAEQIAEMELQTMQDLWDNRLVFRNPITVGNNVYGSSSHYDILWYHPHNDERVADGTVFKRTSYEMLGVGGIEGRIAYASGQSDNDLEAIRAVTGDDTMTWESYKMSRWVEVEANLEHLDHFDSEVVIERYVEALKKDAESGSRSNTNTLRNTLYNAIKHNTEDFDKGSDAYHMNYQTEISSAQQLVDVVNQNDWGSYILTNDIDFSGVPVNEGTKSYATNNFVGVLDGNGFGITGLDVAMFNQADYGHFKNILIENIDVSSGDVALIANTVNNSVVDTVSVKNINVNLPLFANKQGSNVELSEVNYEIANTKIYTLEDLLAIETSEEPLAKQAEYTLMADIDASSLSGESPMISESFSGTIKGNGHTIKGLTKPIFENLTGTVTNLKIEGQETTVNQAEFGLLGKKTVGGKVSGVTIENVTIKGAGYNQVGTLFGSAQNAIIENIKVNHVTVTAHNEMAGIIGKVQNSTMRNIEVNDATITVGLFYGGGAFGRVHGSTIENVYVEGKISTTRTHTGGVAGVLRDNTVLKNVVSNIEVLKPTSNDSRNSNGGIVGAFETNNGGIINAVQISDVGENIFKIASDENSGQGKVMKGYELSDRTGVSSTNSAIQQMVSSELTEAFYRDTLGLDEEIWDYSEINMNGYPTLK